MVAIALFTMIEFVAVADETLAGSPGVNVAFSV
jgi:hypothetical protein